MHRRRWRGLGAAGGAGQWPEAGPPLASDSEDEELPWRSAPRDAASPPVVLESDPEEPDARPDGGGLRKRRRAPAPRPDPAVGAPKKPRWAPQSAPGPDVQRKPAVPHLGPRNRPVSPRRLASPDVEHLESGGGATPGLERGAGAAVPPKTPPRPPGCLRTALEASGEPDVGGRGPNPDVGGAKNGCPPLVVDSDTDVEDAEVLPAAGHRKIRRVGPGAPRAPDVEPEPPHPDVGGRRNGCSMLADSDTDVEAESSCPAAGGPGSGQPALVVDSDTDVEGDGADPDVGGPQTPRTPQNVPKPQNFEVQVQNADVEDSQEGLQLCVVDSDTDVEEDGADPDVGAPQRTEMVQNIPKPQNVRWSPTVQMLKVPREDVWRSRWTAIQMWRGTELIQMLGAPKLLR
ncbi:uncharacterized protein VSU04_015875 [Chlamydotis macqueenii]